MPDIAAKVALYGLIVCWWLFALTFWLRPRPPRVREAKRDWTSLLGLLLQAAGYCCVTFPPLLRGSFVPLSTPPQVVQWGRALLALVLAIGSVYLVNLAARRLGKHWALAARLLEGHTLIQEGPYRFVRNPIYTGMLGMLLATSLALGQWLPLLPAIFLFFAGTWVRVRSEERLLREAFGPEFEAYTRNVPALIPGIY